MALRPIAFYLPQFHPIPENDQWWGKGFTDWRNVVKARPQFPGHYQPHLPADLGFYDLRLPETRQAQADLAREYGIYGFCYYHYWFNGKRILERPFNEVLESGQPDLPFCLCWANENWTRAWDGRDQEVLIAQQYSAEDDVQHIRWLARAFQDERYIRIGDKPLLLVYRASQIPRPLETTAIWRDEARKMGVGELFLCRVEHFRDERGDPTRIGFDAAVEFQPKWPAPSQRTIRYGAAKLGLLDKVWRWAEKLGLPRTVWDYRSFVQESLRQPPPPYKRFPCVAPSWDNTSRRKGGAGILHNATPQVYETWLRAVIAGFTPPAPDENLIFINAWNEWAEGCHLEPCHKWGRGYLEATRRALDAAK